MRVLIHGLCSCNERFQFFLVAWPLGLRGAYPHLCEASHSGLLLRLLRTLVCPIEYRAGDSMAAGVSGALAAPDACKESVATRELLLLVARCGEVATGMRDLTLVEPFLGY